MIRSERKSSRYYCGGVYDDLFPFSPYCRSSYQRSLPAHTKNTIALKHQELK